MRYSLIKNVLGLLCLLFVSACINIADKKTAIAIEDNDRHYYPILAGQQKDLAFMVKNTGENPLLVTDIITSCGCLKVNGDDALFSIPPGKERILTMRYNSAKNVGYVKHYVTLYGNFEKESPREIMFDINVVPDALYTKDYEELYKEQQGKKGAIQELVDGKENNRGYFLDADVAPGVDGKI